MSFNSDDSWIILTPIEQSIKNKIESIGIPLKDWGVSINYGIKTGCNEAFIIDGETKDQLIAEDPKSAEIIRPILRGRDIKRYGYSFADLWLIASHNGIKGSTPPIDITDYPAVKNHLDHYWEKISIRADKGITPYNLRNCAYMDDFSKQKITWGNLCLSAQFALVEENMFVNAPSPIIVPGDKYILAILNSTLGDWYIRQLGVTRNGGYFEYKPMFVEKLPIPKPDQATRMKLETLVGQVLSDSKEESIAHPSAEADIDSIVFNIYGLTTDEIEYIKVSGKSSVHIHCEPDLR